MTLADVPEVVVDPSGGYKFIVAKLTDNNGEEKLVVRANKDCNYHNHILEMLCREVQQNGLKTYCIGGGQIQVNPEAKTIFIWDDSSAFGKEPDRQETVRMLQKEFPESQIIAD